MITNVSLRHLYSDYLKEFLAYRSEETISFISYDTGAVENNKFSFLLTPESLNYVRSVEYYLYCIADDGIAEGLGYDNDATINGNEVTILFEGNWVELGGVALCCEPKEKNGQVTIFQSFVAINDEVANLLFSFDAVTGKTNIIGITYEYDDYTRIYDLPDHTHLDFMKQYVEFETDGNGNRITTDTAFGYIPEYGIDYTSDMEINVFFVPDGNYQYTASVTDIYTCRCIICS